MIMKQQKHLLSIFFITSVLVLAACSNNDHDEPAPSTQAANSNTPAPPTETLKSDAKVKRSDADIKRLKGKVQAVTETVYPGGNTNKFSLKNTFKFDKNGNRLELINYKPDGSLNSNIRSAYDSEGKVVSEETILANGTVDFKSVIKTDDKGNRVEQDDIKQNAKGSNLFNFKYTFRYDAEAREIERLGHRGNGNFFLKYTFNYDAKGNRTEWLQLTQTNQIIGKVTYKYDENNNIIEETKFKGDGTQTETSTFTYEFDKKGNWTRAKKMQNGAVVEVRVREYKYF